MKLTPEEYNPDLLENARLGQDYLQRTNTLAYFDSASMTIKKRFIPWTPVEKDPGTKPMRYVFLLGILPTVLPLFMHL